MRIFIAGEYIEVPDPVVEPLPPEMDCGGFGPMQRTWPAGTTPPVPVPPYIVIEAYAEDAARSAGSV